MTCPVPSIRLANACPFLVLHPVLTRPFPYLKQQVQLAAYCTKTERRVEEPHIGCGECHPLPPEFTGGPIEPDAFA